MEMHFEIENDILRPEFDVLKPYFIRLFRSKSVEVSIYAELRNGKTIAKIASCDAFEELNREIIETVRFRFIEREIMGKRPDRNSLHGMLDLKQLQEQDKDFGLFLSDEKFVDEVLKGRKYRHKRNIRFLSSRHDRSLMKLRFVLSPFSFVFLLKGKTCYHFVLETLDTEEATYIWHVKKDRGALSKNLGEIDKALNLIRTKGREAFLESRPENFSRVFHDYSDERKGFILWKDNLEERLV
jgi:hypothetical protein